MLTKLFRGRFPPLFVIILTSFACLSLFFSFSQFPSWLPHEFRDAIRSESHLLNASTTCKPALIDFPDKWASSRFLKGAPTRESKDNLLEHEHYITAFPNAGLTNQFMVYVNMIFLGLLSDRIPIVPPFAPDHHITYSAGALPFGRVFNLSRAREALKSPLIEWHEVKALSDPSSIAAPAPSEREHIGCWSTKPESEAKPLRVSSIVDNLRLDISYTRVPMETRRDDHDRNDNFIDFTHLVPYIFPKEPVHPPDFFPLMDPSPMGRRLAPGTRLACFDHLYYATSSLEIFEWRFSWSPAWRFVAKHLYFTDFLYDLAKAYLARAFKTTQYDLPLFIAVHIRRGDFKNQCYDGRPADQCLIPLSKFHKEVDRIRDEIRQTRNAEVERVIVMSDEEDPAFWKDIDEMGWARIDHAGELTLEKYGEWMGPVLDQVAQSLAVGFVGTEDSTFSLVSMRRVQDWNRGPGILLTRDPYQGK